jgi:hypothetical protein
MMESPSKYSVEQLLKARQDGVPDYIVVPMIQKAMAEKQASQNQQAMQQGAQKPPTVAQQVLSSAAQTMSKEKQLEGMPDIPTEDVSVTPRGMGKHPMADVQEEMGEEPEQMAAGGIAALRSGLPNEYAHGGIIAFANGTDDKGVPEAVDIVANDPEHFSRTNAFGGISETDPKTGKQHVKHWAKGADSLNAEHANIKEDHGMTVRDRELKYYGHDKSPEQQAQYLKNFEQFSGVPLDTKINKDDPELIKKIAAGTFKQEQGLDVPPSAQDAILAGKPYRVKGRDGQAAPAKEAPKGIASLVQPKEASPLDLSELENLKSTSEDRDINAQMAKAEKLYGTNPDYERRAKSYDEQETKLKGDDDKAMWKALMHAGIGMMSGKSPNFMSNLASGVTAGAEDYEKTREDIDAKKAHLAQLRDALGDARRQERLAVAKYGADSVQASKASDKALALEGVKLKASRGEKELSAEVQGQANAIRAAELPSEIGYKEAAAAAQLANAAESAYKSSPEGRKKEELRGVSADIHDANAVITSSNATEEDKAHARLRLSTLESRLFELTGVKPTPPATTSITPESKGYLPFTVPTDVMGLLKKHLPTS